MSDETKNEAAEPEAPANPYAEHLAHWDKTLAGGETMRNALVHIAARALKGQKKSAFHVSVEMAQHLDALGADPTSLGEALASQCEELAHALEERGDLEHARSIAALPELLGAWMRGDKAVPEQGRRAKKRVSGDAKAAEG